MNYFLRIILNLFPEFFILLVIGLTNKVGFHVFVQNWQYDIQGGGFNLSIYLCFPCDFCVRQSNSNAVLPPHYLLYFTTVVEQMFLRAIKI